MTAELERKKRTNALSKFTRNLNTLTSFLEDNSPPLLVNPQYEKLRDCWEKLEATQDEFIEKTDIDVEVDRERGIDFLNAHATKYREVMKLYSAYLKKSATDEEKHAEKKAADDRKVDDDHRKHIETEKREAEIAERKVTVQRQFAGGKVEFDSFVRTFNQMNVGVKDLTDASDDDFRSSWQKVEQEFTSAKEKYIATIGLDHEQDNEASAMETTFLDAEKTFLETQKWALVRLNKPVANSGDVDSKRTARNSTKREEVRLPSFKGDEKTLPYLNFPTWKEEWEGLVEDYEMKYRSSLLREHLDEAARSKLIGCETNYTECMVRLTSFYGDHLKVVSCVMKDVSSPRPVNEGDYRGLIAYSVTLENNFNRLKNMNREFEMSNTTTMTSIVQKLPRLVGEKWNEHLSLQTSGVKNAPFTALISWLVSQREMWERMAVTERKPSKNNSSSFYGEEFSESKETRSCFRCRQSGHISRDCPQSAGTNNNDANNRNKRPRKPPQSKKHWCAFHKEDQSRRCWSNSCQDLRKISDVAKRIKLLKDNGDCVHCCGDHKPSDCNYKDRVCGGGKEGRGCSNPHKQHELFCSTAKLCFAVINARSMATSEVGSEGVVLLIMKVRTVTRNGPASVFWDLGCDSNFVRDKFAKQCGFKGREDTLSVTTLGGTVTDYRKVTTYTCKLRDVDGEIVQFEAYSLESITGSLTKIDVDLIGRLFPHLKREVIQSLARGDHVDFLIGMLHPSWHPERAQRATGGGDCWLYRGRFGVCVGGRHPEITERTERSDALFSVNHVYHAKTRQVTSHALEYCVNRVAMYKSSDVCRTQVADVSPVRVVSSLQDVTSVPSVDTTVPDGVTVQDVSSIQDGSTLRDVSSRVSSTEDVHSSQDVSTLRYESTVEDRDFCNGPTVGNISTMSDNSLVQDVSISSAITSSSVLCHATKTSLMSEDRFFQSEALGTFVEPKCGSCKCTKCPVPGSKYSLKEQREYDEIQKNLFYDDEQKCWVTEYPWKCDRNVLPRNEKLALQSLNSLERNLMKNPELADDFCKQIDEMVNRGSAVVLSEEELSGWGGDYYYLPVLGVKGKKKCLRVVFDASRRQGGYASMNDCLAKGPDRFINNIVSVILGFQNGRVGCAGDIKKFHNCVRLVPEDIHMQRFLWRSMKTDESPKTYAVLVNNFGIKSANCIATSALHKSADLFSHVYPIESKQIKEQTYVDDELLAAVNKEEALLKTARIDEICEHASMPNKGWLYSGDKSTSELPIGGENTEPGDKVLGLLWDSESDTFRFNAELHLKCREENGSLKDVIVTTVEELEDLDVLVTRRIMLCNVSRIFDPCGLWSAILLQSKLLLRESWSNELGWDDPLPDGLAARWLTFLKSLLSLKEVRFPRSLWPESEVKGLPMLIIFSDGSEKAFGAVAYIRWELSEGGYWTQLIMAKSKIAPKNRVTIPKMELDGGNVGNRMKNFIVNETNFEFSHVRQFVDSSTALGYVHKECGVFGPYEGVRVAEIHSSNVFIEGKLEGWAWVAGEDNPADWCTKPRTVHDMMGSDFWQKGPEFLQTDESSWPVKHSYRTDKLDGEKTTKTSNCLHIQTQTQQQELCDLLNRLVERISLWKKMCRVLAWLLRLGTVPSVSGPLTFKEVQNAKRVLIKFAQNEIELELKDAAESGTGRFRKLAPIQGEDGIWRVGSRMRNLVPFTIDASLPKIIPRTHKIAQLIMRDCHNFCHAGQDGTLCRFRAQGYWAVKAGCLAKKTKSECVPCRKMERYKLFQPLGEFSIERLREPMAWGYCQLDLFGPFHCRGDVNPRTTKKIWGIILEDANSGAVHLDIVQDYSANSVIMSLRRFGSLRGWPGIICSDPGSQLESAGGKLDTWWASMGDTLRTLGSEKNFKWEISPPDSPWRQGKAERRIAIVKKLLKIAVGDSRVTPIELQTILMESSNICNERPIGLSKPREDGSYVLITPNQLLMGRSNSILPDDANLVSELPVASRYRLVNHATTAFWKMWCSHVSPGLVVRQKWHTKSRNLQKGDLVMICEDSKIKSKYKLGVVDDVKVSGDNLVRSATVRYVIIRKNPHGEDKITHKSVTRSVQRLALIMPVEESAPSPIIVKDREHSVECGIRL